MAGADYKLCDICDAKAFYDAEISYDYERGEYESCGQSKALCMRCSEEWELKSIKKEKK